MPIHSIDHFNIRTTDLPRLVSFYTEVLSFELGERPPFDSPGAWLYIDSHPLLHVSVTDQAANGDTQPFDHIAFRTTGLNETIKRLDSAAVPYKLVDVPGRAMKQVFITDPDGIKLELNFSEAPDV